jgi:hypothetical protein
MSVDCVYLIRNWWALVNTVMNLKGEDLFISRATVGLLKQQALRCMGLTHTHINMHNGMLQYSAFERSLCNNENRL